MTEDNSDPTVSIGVELFEATVVIQVGLLLLLFVLLLLLVGDGGCCFFFTALTNKQKTSELATRT